MLGRRIAAGASDYRGRNAQDQADQYRAAEIDQDADCDSFGDKALNHGGLTLRFRRGGRTLDAPPYRLPTRPPSPASGCSATYRWASKHPVGIRGSVWDRLQHVPV